MGNENGIIAFDTETTGLLVPGAASLDDQPQIIELYAGKFNEDGEQTGEFHALLDPGKPLPEIIKKITGITDDDLKGMPKFDEVFDEMAQFFCGAKVLTAHNLEFDKCMLGNELARIDKLLDFPWPPTQICTVIKSLGYEGYRLSLAKLYAHLFDGETFAAHRADVDVRAQAKCFFEMMKRGDILL